MTLKAKITPVEDWQKAVKEHIDKLDENDKREFAHKVIYEITLWTGYNPYEMCGILEAVKFDLLTDFKYMELDEDDDE